MIGRLQMPAILRFGFSNITEFAFTQVDVS